MFSADNRSLREGLIIPVVPESQFWIGKQVQGQAGFQVVVLKKQGSGTSYHRTLYPGENLPSRERLGRNYIAWAVDIRRPRKTSATDSFYTGDNINVVTVGVDVHYHAVDAKKVVINTQDAVQTLVDRINKAVGQKVNHTHYTDITSARLCTWVDKIERQDKLKT